MEGKTNDGRATGGQRPSPADVRGAQTHKFAPLCFGFAWSAHATPTDNANQTNETSRHEHTTRWLGSRHHGIRLDGEVVNVHRVVVAVSLRQFDGQRIHAGDEVSTSAIHREGCKEAPVSGLRPEYVAVQQ